MVGNCPTCNRNEDCELQAIAREMGIEMVTYKGEVSEKFY
jgi:NADH dehydrogenase/NADH:ubiquinone oxidoreductase subunit G